MLAGAPISDLTLLEYAPGTDLRQLLPLADAVTL